MNFSQYTSKGEKCNNNNKSQASLKMYFSKKSKGSRIIKCRAEGTNIRCHNSGRYGK